MRQASRHAFAAALFAFVPFGAAATSDCRQAAMAQLRASSADGVAIFRQTDQPGFFESWLDCGDAQYGLPTAIHESTHVVTSETDAFPLVGGGAIARPHEVSAFFPPYRIAGRFTADDFTGIYLARGKASSATDFLYLLDEFNAYSHDLAAAVSLKALASPNEAVDHRDGLAAMMAFLVAFSETARASEPETWGGLRRPPVARTISALWNRAERVMASACGIPNFGSSDRAYLRQVCAAGPGSALEEILGRAPVCPTACLETTPETAAAEAEVAPSSDATDGSEVDVTEQTASIRPRHPFGGNAGPRRHPAPRDDAAPAEE